LERSPGAPLSTHALRTSEPGRAARRGVGGRILRWLDFALLALALPIFLVADLPLAGYAAAGGAWVAQRALRGALARVAAPASPGRATGILGASLLGRLWMVALAILAVGLTDREAGLAAAVLAVALFQVYFTAHMVARGIEVGGKR
jgi:hypothetical protein